MESFNWTDNCFARGRQRHPLLRLEERGYEGNWLIGRRPSDTLGACRQWDVITQSLLAAFETYKAENEKFIEKGKASAAPARKALQEIAGACKERRKEITATKYSELFAQACASSWLGKCSST